MQGGVFPTSLVIASRGRPAALRRCLTAVRQLDHPEFEVIVVADAAGLWAVADMGLTRLIKTVQLEEANISTARNLGIAMAAGEIVAFIDDDAVPEPTWLSRLVAPFSDPRVTAATGFVLGRNGLTFQWQAGWTDVLGWRHPLEVEEQAITLHESSPGAAVRTEGTNMAFRREVLAELGGFDPSFRFYMDETDLNMRQAAEGQITAVVPLAQVHHGFLAGPHRRDDRVPLSLFEIGASLSAFLRKHAPLAAHGPRINAFRIEQRRRLLRHMVSGGIEPRDVSRLMATLEDGFDDGARRPLRKMRPIAPPTEPFHPLPDTGPRPGRCLAGWFWQGWGLRRHAGTLAADGAIVTVLRLSPTPFRHRVRYHPDGYWEQSGGLFGRSLRDRPAPIRPGIATRLRREVARIALTRPVDSLLA